MNKNRPKLLLIIICIFLATGVGVWLNGLYSCGPKVTKISEKIEGLGDSLANSEIVLFKSHPGHKINLIGDTMTIKDAETLKENSEDDR